MIDKDALHDLQHIARAFGMLARERRREDRVILILLKERRRERELIKRLQSAFDLLYKDLGGFDAKNK